MTLIQAALREQGRSVQWLASKLGVERSYVGRMISGRRPLPDAHARQIATLLGLPLSHIQPETHDREPVAV